MNKVRITVFSAQPPLKGGTLSKTVEIMLRHWKKQFDKVLMDKPDLIVLPEEYASHVISAW